MLPHLQPLNTLAGAAAWEGERVRKDDPAAFVAWHEDALRSAAHAGDGWPLVSGLIEAAMRHRSIDALSTNLAALPPDVLAGLRARLDAIPPCVDFHRAMEAEKAFGIDWFIRRLVDVEQGQKSADAASNFAANRRALPRADQPAWGHAAGRKMRTSTGERPLRQGGREGPVAQRENGEDQGGGGSQAHRSGAGRPVTLRTPKAARS